MIGLRGFFIVVLISMGLYFLRGYMRGATCHLSNRIDGKAVLITGANTGLGLETAIELASRGGIIHMACRSEDKCKRAREIVLERSKTGSEKVLTHSLDLSSMKSILSLSNKLGESLDKLDILINNAGIMMFPYEETEEGFEMQIGVNYIGHFLLTRELLNLLKKGDSARIIIVSSAAHKSGSINTTDFNLRGEDYGLFKAYSQSKLANVLHAKVLSQRLEKDGIAVVSIHPGVVATELGRHFHTVLLYILKLVQPIMIKTAYEGAQTQICCAVNPDLLKYSGEYFSDCAPIQSSNKEVYNDSLATLLWQQTESTINNKLRDISL